MAGGDLRGRRLGMSLRDDRLRLGMSFRDERSRLGLSAREGGSGVGWACLRGSCLDRVGKVCRLEWTRFGLSRLFSPLFRHLFWIVSFSQRSR